MRIRLTHHRWPSRLALLTPHGTRIVLVSSGSSLSNPRNPDPGYDRAGVCSIRSPGITLRIADEVRLSKSMPDWAIALKSSG